jgi:hypothetical protein
MLGDECHLDLDAGAVVRGLPFQNVLVEQFEIERVPRTRGTMYRGSAMK